jgi:UDP-2,4-diacetamido-2,4,6-trideoxy-beta-L-altropyranose hydrolase
MLRTDASAAIGAGHFGRCLALAQAWQRAGGNATFVMTDPSGTIASRLKREGIDLLPLALRSGGEEDALATRALIREAEATAVVVDGYQFTEEYHDCLSEAGARVAIIDDEAKLGRYAGDILLNQNPHATLALYRGKVTPAKLLLGLQYALIRQEFRRFRDWQRPVRRLADRVLVTFGGSDPTNVTTEIVRALGDLTRRPLQVRVVAGSENAHVEALDETVRGEAGFQLLVGVADMAELMAWSDVAVSAAGSTCWELARMGVPSVVVPLAENQVPIAGAMAAEGVAIHERWEDGPDAIVASLQSLLDDAGTRQKLSWRGQQLVDGEGADRVSAQLAGAA